MTWTLEQQEMQRTVRRLLESQAAQRTPTEVVPEHDAECWQAMASQLGLAGLLIPERYGGAGLDMVELAIVMEELGRSLACTPFFASVVLAARTIIESGDESAMASYLPGFADGSRTGTLAGYETGGGWNDAELSTRAEQAKGVWQVTGAKSHVVDGDLADVIVLSAMTTQGVSLFVVEGTTTGVTLSVEPTMDLTRRLATVRLDQASARLLGTQGDGRGVLLRVLDLASIALAAEQVGGAQRCLEMSVDYAKLRFQFGRPIGSFQAIKHRCADMLMAVESARSTAYQAAGCATTHGADLPALASLAKAYCSQTYVRVAADTIQVHGGIGFTWEHPAHLHYRRAKSSALLLGDPAFHREQLARRLRI